MIFWQSFFTYYLECVYKNKLPLIKYFIILGYFLQKKMKVSSFLYLLIASKKNEFWYYKDDPWTWGISGGEICFIMNAQI